jgi:hypothetical protein
MTTSGTRDFNLDIAEAIEEAYERIGREMRTGYDAKTARRSLNLMFAEWANRGLNLWTVVQDTLTVTQGVAQYTLQPDVVDILDMSLRRDGTDIEMERISRSDYLDFPNKADQGRPSQFFFDRQISPVVNLWQTPENSTDQLVYYYVRRIEDAGGLTNTTGIPFRFYPCMVAGLAYYLAIKRAPERVQMMKSIYEEEFQRAAMEDEDRVPLIMRPSGRYLRV